MKVIFSRKGFDSTAGRCPSPILGGRPVSLPIPTSRRSTTTYGDLGLAAVVRSLTRGRLDAASLCHHDPDLMIGALGQTGAAQAHLDNEGVRAGDLFLFWGLFRDASGPADAPTFAGSGPAHHRLFGWLQIGEVCRLGEDGTWAHKRYPYAATHPHLSPGWNANNTLYVAAPWISLDGRRLAVPGHGLARSASDSLRLSVPSGRPTEWRVPDWLNPKSGGVGMSYNRKDENWQTGRCRVAARGQEFVADITGRADAVAWLNEMLEEMNRA